MDHLLLLLSTIALTSAQTEPQTEPQSCSCEDSPYDMTDLRFNCPVDSFCSDSLVDGECGLTCHAEGSFHSMPYDDTDSNIVIGNHGCAGANFDFDFGGSVLCAYSTPSNVLSTSNTCNVQVFECEGCDSSAIRYFDFDDETYQILCESGLIQYLTSDGSSYEYDYRLWIDKESCDVFGGGTRRSEQPITAVSCRVRPYEIDACAEELGSPQGLTGHCRYGTCWLYCEDNKQLSFSTVIDDPSPRIKAEVLVCEGGFSQYGQGTAFYASCD